MKIVYVAGPFRGKNAWEVKQNVDRAERVAAQVWELGAMAYCPHLNTAHFDGFGGDSQYLDGNLDMLRRAADAVILVEGWERSKGTLAEIELAKRLDVPVFCDIRELSAWMGELDLD